MLQIFHDRLSKMVNVVSKEISLSLLKFPFREICIRGLDYANERGTTEFVRSNEDFLRDREAPEGRIDRGDTTIG